jgi:hypothetical protein
VMIRRKKKREKGSEEGKLWEAAHENKMLV